MNYIGIDPSLTGTGIIVLNDKCEIIKKMLISTSSKDTTEKRVFKILEEIKKSLSKDCIVYIEGLSFHSTGRSILELAGLHYIITFFLYNNNILFKEIEPTKLKKWLTGSGRVKKNLMLLHVFKKFNIEFNDDNICDAYCLSRKCYEDNKNG